MALGINYTDVVFAVKVVAVAFLNFMWEVVWVKFKGLVAFVLGFDRGDLRIMRVENILSCMWHRIL